MSMSPSPVLFSSHLLLLFVMVVLLINVLLYLSSRAYRRKLVLAGVGVKHMLLSKDRKYTKKTLTPSSLSHRKHLVFIRHGESEWNVVFNPKKRPDDKFALYLHMLLWRFLKALLVELVSVATHASLALDSPLSQRGIAQAEQLAKYIESPEICMNPEGEHDDYARFLLRGVLARDENAPTSTVACSNLRRCMLTALVALRSRICPTGHASKPRNASKAHVTTDLQEMSRNVDCVAMALEPASLPPSLGRNLKPQMLTAKNASQLHQPGPLEQYFDASECRGMKTLRSNGRLRMEAFARWAMKCDEEVVIAVGHSLYFREFFNLFTRESDRDDKNSLIARACESKMANCSMVGFELAYDEVMGSFQVMPSTLRVLDGGFESARKKSK